MAEQHLRFATPIRGKGELARLMQHRQPMLLLDNVLEYTSQYLLADVEITADSTFFDSRLRGVPAWAGIEYMAQAIAALSGLRRRKTGASINLGMLISARKVSFEQPAFADGAALLIQVTELAGADVGMAAYRCEITDRKSNAVLSRGQLGVYNAAD